MRLLSILAALAVPFGLMSLNHASTSSSNGNRIREIPMGSASEDSPRDLASARTKTLLISEEMVQRLELNRDQLHEFAYTESTPGGWKLQLLPRDKLFKKLGFHNGEEISYEALQAQADSLRNSRQVDRIMDIFRSIER